MKAVFICLVATTIFFSCRKTPTTLDPPATDTPLTVHTKKMGGMRYWRVAYEYHQTQPTVFDTSYTYLDTFEITVIDDTTLDLGNITGNNIVSFMYATTKPNRLIFQSIPYSLPTQLTVQYYYTNDAIRIGEYHEQSNKYHLLIYDSQ